MTGRPPARATSTAHGARLIVAGAAVGLGALWLAGPAGAQPDVPPPVPGQPGVVAAGDPAPPPAPPPVGAPPVPQVQNQQYGSGDGPLGFLRDAWHQAQNPYGLPGAPGELPVGAPPPPGAGPAPALPPGFTSLTAPESSTPALAPAEGPEVAGPPLPPGYYPLDGPPPPGYFDAPPPAAPAPPAAPPKIIAGQP